MDIGRRAHYRVKVDDAASLQVAVKRPRDSLCVGHLIDLSASGVGIRFLGLSAPNLTVGEEIDLVFSSEKLNAPLTWAARVQHRAEEDGSRRYGFRFLQAQKLDAHLPPVFRQYFNRRRAVRVAPDPARPVSVTLAAAPEGLPLDARLENISALGVGVSLEAGLDAAFVETTKIRISIDLPDARRPITMVAHIRYRRLVGSRIYYGVEFDPEVSEDFERQQDIIVKYVTKRERRALRKSA